LTVFELKKCEFWMKMVKMRSHFSLVSHLVEGEREKGSVEMGRVLKEIKYACVAYESLKK